MKNKFYIFVKGKQTKNEIKFKKKNKLIFIKKYSLIHQINKTIFIFLTK